MKEKVQIKANCTYGGHAIKANRAVDLTFKFPYDELPNYIKVVQLINENTTIKTKLSKDSPVSEIGVFMLKEMKIDHDGEGIIKFNSLMDHVEADKINLLARTEIFKVMFEAEVEVENEDE